MTNIDWRVRYHALAEAREKEIAALYRTIDKKDKQLKEVRHILSETVNLYQGYHLIANSPGCGAWITAIYDWQEKHGKD